MAFSFSGKGNTQCVCAQFRWIGGRTEVRPCPNEIHETSWRSPRNEGPFLSPYCWLQFPEVLRKVCILRIAEGSACSTRWEADRMAELEQRLARLRALNEAVRASDPHLANEGRDTAQSALPAAPALELMAAGSSIENEVALESIILRQTRPVLAILHNETRLDFTDQADSEIWRERLENAKAPLDRGDPRGRPHRSHGRAASTGSAPAGWSPTTCWSPIAMSPTNSRSATATASRSSIGSDGLIARRRRFPAGDRQSRHARLQAGQAAAHRGCARPGRRRSSRSRSRGGDPKLATPDRARGPGTR